MQDPAILPLSKYPSILQNKLLTSLFDNINVIVATGVKTRKQVKYLLFPADFYKCYIPSFFLFFFFFMSSFYERSSAVPPIEVFHPKFQVWSVAWENLNSILAMLRYLKSFEWVNSPLPNSPALIKFLRFLNPDSFVCLVTVHCSMSSAVML